MIFSACSNSENKLNRLVERDIKSGQFGYDSLENPLQSAVYHDNINYAKMLITQGCDVHFINKEQENLLFIAAHYSGVEMNRLLISKGLNINQVNSSGWTPFNMACRYGSKDVVRLYLENGANFKELADNPIRSIFKRSSSGGYEIIELLADKGFNLNDTSYDILHSAIAYDLSRYVTLLIEKGVDYKKTDKNGWSYLHWAAYYNAYECANLLYKYKDLNIRTSNLFETERYVNNKDSIFKYQSGLFPVDIARINNNLEVYNILKQQRQLLTPHIFYWGLSVYYKVPALLKICNVG